MDVKDFPFEIKAVDETGVFEGQLATYGNIDETGDVIDRGAFTKTLQEGGRLVPLLWQHDREKPIGTLSLSDSPNALMARGKLVLEVPLAREAYALMKAGALRGLSIGYRTIKSIPGENGVRRLKEIRLYEGSVVTIPANLQATVTGVKTVTVDDDMEALEMFRNANRDLRHFYDRLVD